MSTIRETVVSSIKTTCRPSVPDLDDPDRPLLDSGVDSLDYAGILMDLEDKFSVQFSNEDMAQLTTVNKIVAFLEAK